MIDTMRSYRFRIYPNKTQDALLRETLMHHRWLWNAAVEQRQAAWRQRKHITAFDQTKEVKLIKRGMPEFAGINSASLGLTLLRLEKAHKAHITCLRNRDF